MASYPEIEAVFVGEAEGTLRDLLMRPEWVASRSEAGLPGIATRERPFVPREPEPNLDNLPCIGDAPDFAASLSCSEYDRSEIPLEAERGCAGRCSFCSTSVYWGRKVRRKSTGRVLEEIRRLRDLTDLTFVSLIGDNLANSRRWLLDLCGQLAQEAQDSLTWGCSLTLSHLRAEDLDVLWKGRCRSIFVGLESASQGTLNKIGKRIDLDRSLAMLEHALAKGFQVHVSLIVGFPWETSCDVRETYNLHVSLLRRGAGSQMSTLCPLPGTLLERTEPIHPREGISAAAFDGLAYGLMGAKSIQRCPELFTQLGQFETPLVSSSEVRATVRAATMASNHYASRPGIEASAGAVGDAARLGLGRTHTRRRGRIAVPFKTCQMRRTEPKNSGTL